MKRFASGYPSRKMANDLVSAIRHFDHYRMSRQEIVAVQELHLNDNVDSSGIRARIKAEMEKANLNEYLRRRISKLQKEAKRRQAP